MLLFDAGTHGLGLSFGRPRLVDFAPAYAVVQFDRWAYLEREWLGESYGAFTEFLRLASDPDVLRSIALDLVALPESISQDVLVALELPVRLRMTAAEVVVALGHPTQVVEFVADRKIYTFDIGTTTGYSVGCTVHDEHGLA